MPGNLFIVCAPSGAGKTSLVAALLASDPEIRKSVSYTTRRPRPGEVNGRDYNFVTTEEFGRMLERGEFLESAQVHGNRYGTSHKWVTAQTARERDILLEIDWQGASQVRKLIPGTIGIFILPPSFDALLARLNKRALDSPEVIARRLENAREEMAHVVEFEYVIINEEFSRAAQDLISIVRAERLKRARQLARHSDLINRMK